MQTFIVDLNFKLSASCLDNKRLGCQRVEARNILVILLGKPEWCSEKQYQYLIKRYKNHPAVLQWKANEIALLDYIKCVCSEWKARGFEENCWLQSIETCKPIIENQDANNLNYLSPWWLTTDFCRMHQSTLLYKNIRHYKRFNWGVNPRIMSYWPVKADNVDYSIARQTELVNFHKNSKETLIEKKMVWGLPRISTIDDRVYSDGAIPFGTYDYFVDSGSIIRASDAFFSLATSIDSIDPIPLTPVQPSSEPSH